MRFKNVAGAQGYGDHILLAGVNNDTVSMVRGTPAILNLNGTNDGFGVVLPSTAGAAKSNAFQFGVCGTQTSGGLAVNAKDDFLAYGYCPYAIIQYATRSASTASWTSSASIASGAILSIDTVNNAFATQAASHSSVGLLPVAVLLDSIASFAASASATTDSRTALTAGLRVFVRFL